MEEIHKLTDSNGADIMIDVVGHPETYEQDFYARNFVDTILLVDLLTPDLTIELPLIDIFNRGGVLQSSCYGACLFPHDCLMLVDLYCSVRFDFNVLATERIALEQVEGVFDTMHDGTVRRLVIEL